MAEHRILIIEDDMDLALGWRTLLKKNGYTVDYSPTVDEAIVLCQTNTYDLIISDLFFENPNSTDRSKGGISFINSIRYGLSGLPQWGRDVPILAVTGSAITNDMDFLNLAGGVGASSTLRKPIFSGTLLAEIEKLLNQK